MEETAAEKTEVACHTNCLALVPSLNGAHLFRIHVRRAQNRRNETDYFMKTLITQKFHISPDIERSIAGVGNKLSPHLIKGGGRVFTLACVSLLRVISGLG